MSAVSLFSPVNPEFLKAFAANEMALDCGTVELKQLRDENPRCYAGRGLLLLREGEFQIRIYTDPAPDDHLAAFDEMRQLSRWKPGEEIPRDEYFELRAKDLSGYEWTCAKVQVKRHGGQHGLVLTGRLFDALVHTARIEDTGGGGSNMYFFDALPLPLNRHATTRTELVGELVRSDVEAVQARFVAGGLQFQIDKKPQESFTVVRATSATLLPAAVPTRVEEALRFVTMRPARWCIAETHSAGQRVVTLLPRREANQPFLNEPVDPRRPDQAEDYWRLFAAFFEYVSQHADPDEYHPLTIQLFHLTEGEAQQLDLVGLSLSVAVEGVLKNAFPKLGAPTPAFQAAVDLINKDIQKLATTEPSLLSRIEGSLGAMKSVRTGDQLRELVKQGVVTKAQSKKWGELRNTVAHAQLRVDPEAANRLWSDCLTVYTLLHRLIFHAIGYQGQYCEYGSPGWPTVAFTLTPPVAGDSSKLPAA